MYCSTSAGGWLVFFSDKKRNEEIYEFKPAAFIAAGMAFWCGVDRTL
jgi:hypothetical protein